MLMEETLTRMIMATHMLMETLMDMVIVKER